MAEQSAALSPTMQALSDAMRAAKPRPQAVFCGFDLWLEVMGSGYANLCNFVAGGALATGDEPEGALVVGVMAIGKTVVVNFDPTLPPTDFYFKP